MLTYYCTAEVYLPEFLSRGHGDQSNAAYDAPCKYDRPTAEMAIQGSS